MTIDLRNMAEIASKTAADGTRVRVLEFSGNGKNGVMVRYMQSVNETGRMG